jgi:hypothetical protein
MPKAFQPDLHVLNKLLDGTIEPFKSNDEDTDFWMTGKLLGQSFQFHQPAQQ